jgi:hypothetical protein
MHGVVFFTQEFRVTRSSKRAGFEMHLTNYCHQSDGFLDVQKETLIRRAEIAIAMAEVIARREDDRESCDCRKYVF